MQIMFHLVPSPDRDKFWVFRVTNSKNNLLYTEKYLKTLWYAFFFAKRFKMPLVIHRKNGTIRKILFKKYLTK